MVFEVEPRETGAMWSLPGRGGAPEPAPGAILAERYLLRREIGRGSHGVVWESQDLLLEEAVAVKVIPSLDERQRQRLRRELTALRWLDLPGVVRLRDEGRLQDATILVMDLVSGRPFPSGPMRWEALEALALALFETLECLHCAGVVHRDLKPYNVLVDEAGRPTILDFGLARGRAVRVDRPGPPEGTPRYVAPEQLLRGPVDARADLYSVGVMLFEALSGRPPHGADNVRAMLGRRLRAPAPRLQRIAPHVPAHVAALVDALLERSPDDRPASAGEVIAELGGIPQDERVALLLRGLPERLEPEHLVGVFGPPNRLLHIGEDAARIVLGKVGPFREAVARELGRWLRQGLARVEDGRIVLDRIALARLETDVVDLPASPEGALRAALDRVGHLRDRGAFAEALGWLDRSAGLAASCPDPALRRRWLLAWCEVTVPEAGAARAVRRALYEVGRASGDPQVETRDLDALLNAALAVHRGEVRRARAILARAALAPEPEASDLVAALRVELAVSHEGPEVGEREIEELEAWADAPERRAALDCWRGICLSMRGRSAEALEHLQRAIATSAQPRRRMVAALNALSAAQGLGDLDLADTLARRLLEDARALRSHHMEALCLLVLRDDAYRRGQPFPPDPTLVEEVAEFRTWTAFRFALVDAAARWRAGDARFARRMARRASVLARRSGFGLGAWFATALAAAAGDRQDLDLLEEARPPDDRSGFVEAQGLALLALARGEPRPRLLPPVEAACEGLPPDQLERRREVLSLSEALRAVRTGRLASPTPSPRPRSQPQEDAT